MRAADAAAAALAFLTRIPVRRALGADDVARGAVLFPLVGAGVGALSGVAALLLYPSVPALAAAGVAVAVELVVTGAMHADALADTADAAGAQTRERALEIMRDSRIGSFGAAALMTGPAGSGRGDRGAGRRAGRCAGRRRRPQPAPRRCRSRQPCPTRARRAGRGAC